MLSASVTCVSPGSVVGFQTAKRVSVVNITMTAALKPLYTAESAVGVGPSSPATASLTVFGLCGSHLMVMLAFLATVLAPHPS